ncbi:MAG TPA: SRPBCC family protein [Rhodoferax sp.]
MKYRFVTIWYIEAPIESVCEAIYNSLNWPQWWRNVESVEELALGDSRGIGSVRRYTWKGRLPYRLTFDVCIIHSEPLAAIEGVASGDVEGNGRWSFTADGAVTAALCEWQVRTTPVWMNLLALFARPFFKWNHNAVMQQGGEALAQMLNARLVEIAHY